MLFENLISVERIKLPYYFIWKYQQFYPRKSRIVKELLENYKKLKHKILSKLRKLFVTSVFFTCVSQAFNHLLLINGLSVLIVTLNQNH